MLVLDEDIAFRADTVERCLRAGKSVYADKTPALSAERVRALVELAQEKDVRLAAWSQLLFAPEAEPLRSVEGGAALVTFNLSPDIVEAYGIHLVCSAFAAFGADPVHMTKIEGGPDSPPMIGLTYGDGKSVVLRAGTDVPPRGCIVYAGPGTDPIVVKLADMAAMFDGSAAALADMFERRTWPVPPEALIAMTEAASLLCQ